MELVLGGGIKRNAIRWPDKEALVFEKKRFSFKELNDRVNQLANGLTLQGLTKGDRVAILLHDCSEYLEIFIALAKVGIVSVPLTYRALAKELEFYINHCDAKGFIFGDEFENIVSEIKPKINSVQEFIILGQKETPGAPRYEKILSSVSKREPESEILETDPIWISYTSGTTGAPKGVVGCHRGWVLQMPLISMEFKIHEGDVFLNNGPLYHTAPFDISLTHLYIGAKVVITKGFDPLETLRMIEKEKVTSVFMVPTMFNFILNLPDEEKRKYDVSSLRTLIVGAAPLLTKTKEEILRFFPRGQLYEFYAATELGMVTTLKPEDQMRKIRCCGKPFPGVEIKLLGKDGKEVPVGEVGELYMKGFNTFKEYLKNPEATQASEREGWLTVGDMARMDEEGFYYIVDRKKDMVISGGVNIYPGEIDEVIQKHPKVLEVAVIGVPDEVWGESIKAVVVLKTGEEAPEEEIKNFCEGKLAKYKIPRSVDFVSSLPKTPGGKILKSVIRSQYWKDQGVKV